MCLPLISSWGPLILCQFFGIVGQVHWHRKCSICAQTPGAYTVDSIAMIVQRFFQGQALPEFFENGLGIVVWLLGLE